MVDPEVSSTFYNLSLILPKEVVSVVSPLLFLLPGINESRVVDDEAMDAEARAFCTGALARQMHALAPPLTTPAHILSTWLRNPSSTGTVKRNGANDLFPTLLDPWRKQTCLAWPPCAENHSSLKFCRALHKLSRTWSGWFVATLAKLRNLNVTADRSYLRALAAHFFDPRIPFLSAKLVTCLAASSLVDMHSRCPQESQVTQVGTYPEQSRYMYAHTTVDSARHALLIGYTKALEPLGPL